MRYTSGFSLGAMACLSPSVLLAASAVFIVSPLRAQAPNVDDLPDLTLTAELRVGSVDDLAAGFARITQVAVHPDGTMYVLDGREGHVAVIDRSGTWLRVIGRPGEGPGEFRIAAELGLKADTLWVTDTSLQRLTLFSLMGQVLTTLPTGRQVVPVTESFRVTSRGRALRGDGLIDDSRIMGTTGGAEPPDSARIPRLLFDRTGSVVDTAWYEIRIRPTPARYVTVGGREWSVPNPPFDNPLYEQLIDGVAIVKRHTPTSTEDAVFTVTRIRGVTNDTVVHSYRYRPADFTSEYIDREIASRVATSVRQAEARGDRLDAGALERAFRGALYYPRYQTPVTMEFGDADGRLWLLRGDDGGPMRRWLLIEPDGTPRGHVALPRDTNIKWAHGDQLYVLELDDFDVPWLVRLRIGG